MTALWAHTRVVLAALIVVALAGVGVHLGSISTAHAQGLGSGDAASQTVFLRLNGPSLADSWRSRDRPEHPVSKAQIQVWMQALDASHGPVRDRLDALGIPILWEYRRALNGFQVAVRPAQRATLEGLAGVIGLHPVLHVYAEADPAHQPATGEAHPTPSDAQKSALLLALDGEGVRIGVVDDGIDYLHSGLGGPGLPGVYDANDPSRIDDEWAGAMLFPNAKVVGGFDFVGDGYDASAGDLPHPDPDPMPALNGDKAGGYDDHGTHVAHVIAGLAGLNAREGIAPAATLWSFRVLSDGASSMTSAALDRALDPNDDGDLSDALDIVNLSLGAAWSGGGADTVSAEALAIDALVSMGTVVVASAGNRGDIPFIISAPAAIPAVIAVANIYAGGRAAPTLQGLSPAAIIGTYPVVAAAPSFAPALEDGDPIVAAGRLAGDACVMTTLPDLTGRIALIERRHCSFGVKLANVSAAGALAAVVLQDEDAPPFVMASAPQSAIPAVMLDKGSADSLRAAALRADIQFSLAGGAVIPSLTDALRASSSRGPGFPERGAGADIDFGIVAKPDIAAPGVGISAALAGSAWKTVTKTGTSAAAAHLSGRIALLKQAQPTLTPGEIKARLLATATPITGPPGADAPTPRSWGGAGRVDLDAALAVRTTIQAGPEGSIDFGARAFRRSETIIRTVSIHNRGLSRAHYLATFRPRAAGDPEFAALSVQLIPDRFTLEPGVSLSVSVAVTVDPRALVPWALATLGGPADGTGAGEHLSAAELDGHLEFAITSDTDLESNLRVPFYLLARPASEVAPAADACLAPEPFALALDNPAQNPGWASGFTALSLGEPASSLWGGADLVALGLRLWGAPEVADARGLEFALVTREGVLHPSRMSPVVVIDTDGDGVGERVLITLDAAWSLGGGTSGVSETVVLRPADPGESLSTAVRWLDENWFVMGTSPTGAGILSQQVVLPVSWEALGDPEAPKTVRAWARTFDPTTGYMGTSDVADSLPINAMQAGLLEAPYGSTEVELACGVWGFEDELLTVPADAAGVPLRVAKAPRCPQNADGTPDPLPVLLLTSNVPGAAGPQIIRVPAPVTTGLCGAIELPVLVDKCVGALDTKAALKALAGHGVCGVGVHLVSKPEGPLLPGIHRLPLVFLDGWGRQSECELAVDVVDDTPPKLACPPALERPLGAVALTMAVPVSDPCGVDLTIDAFACVGRGECSAILDANHQLTLNATGALTEVRWRMRAVNPNGGLTTVECSIPVDIAPSGGTAKGCRAGSRGHTLSLMSFTLMALLFWRRRRRHCNGAHS